MPAIGQGESFSIRLPHRKHATPKVKDIPSVASRTPTPVPKEEPISSKTKEIAICIGISIIIASFFSGFYFLAMRKAAANSVKCDPDFAIFEGKCVSSSLHPSYVLARKASKYIANVQGDCYFTRKLPTPEELQKIFSGLNVTFMESEPMFNVQLVNGTIHSTNPNYKFLCQTFNNDSQRDVFYGFVIVIIISIVSVCYWRHK